MTEIPILTRLSYDVCMISNNVSVHKEMARHLESGQLEAFKQRFCDENGLIAQALSVHLCDKLIGPVLDVGAGLGDIALGAFPDVPAILLDREPINGPVSTNHRRMVGDFFDYASKWREPIGTLFLCHVLQYIDNDENALRGAIERLRPRNIICVTNDNVGEFGRIISWAEARVPDANPEYPLDLSRFSEMTLRREIPIVATLSYPDFDGMARDLLTVILDATPNEEIQAALRDFVSAMLERPTLTISQTIRYYE